MKKLLALILCICICVLTFSCNKVENPVNTEPTEPELTETEPTETEPTETEPPEPEPVKLNINVVKDNKIVIPRIMTEYIVVTWNIGKREDSSSAFFTEYPGDEFIFRRPESIARIVSFFEELPLGAKKSGPSGNAESLVIRFYSGNNTYLEFGSPHGYRLCVPTGINDEKEPFLSYQFYECYMHDFVEVCCLVKGW